MDKLKMHSPDLSQDNISKIRALFPNCVTESSDDSGNVKLAIDFDQLKQELSDSIVEGPQERYHLNWPGKREALLTANAPIAKTLRPCREESVNFDTTENLFIEGDNLEALKLLQETYLGRVKMIYIDPPYNTGNDFIYKDDFSEDKDLYLLKTKQIDLESNKLLSNPVSNGRFHSDWLTMMYSRLKLARNLLADNGVMFISIDDNEAHNLIKVGCEVFGEENFIAQLAVQLNPRGRNLDKFVAKTHEYILIFVKDALEDSSLYGLEKEGKMVDEYNREDEFGKFRLTGLRNRNQSFNPTTRPKLYYPLYVNPKNGEVSVEKNNEHTDEVWPDAPGGIQTCWTWGKEKASNERGLLLAELSNHEWRIFRKDYLLGKNGAVATTLAKSVWIDKEINNDYGRKTIKELFGSAVMSFPKSVQLIEKLIKMGTKDGDIVLDFFAGSSTTPHAVINVNQQENTNRKFIAVQLPELCDEKSDAFKAGYKTIAELSKARISKVCNINKDSKSNHSIGFRTLAIDTSNMTDIYYQPDQVSQEDMFAQVENIKADRTDEDLLFQVLLDWGVGLTLPISKQQLSSKDVFFVNADENGEGADLIACFGKDISNELIKALAEKQPLRVVFRDDGFANDSVKINVEQIFKQISPMTDVKSI
ncbi:site-specific DNA-methyltransferase [Shewanella ulleungensis]|uniref:site-specific DNA-methyltransferase n=1 Tax=Shewanella ulleungensis TaxID=2282699 RepID=UPI003D7A073F